MPKNGKKIVQKNPLEKAFKKDSYCNHQNNHQKKESISKKQFQKKN